jgi:hypothetical protein
MIPLTVPEIRRLLAALLLRPRPATPRTGWTSEAATGLAPAGTTSEPASLAMPRSPRSVSDWQGQSCGWPCRALFVVSQTLEQEGRHGQRQGRKAQQQERVVVAGRAVELEGPAAEI